MKLQKPSLNVRINPHKALGELCRRRFYRFVLEMWETIEAVEFIPNWHIEEICNQLQEVYEIWETGESQPDVLVNVPPGSSKSTVITQLYPAWLWVRNPSIRVISTSYSSALATAHAVKTRDCLKSDKFTLMYGSLITFKSDTDGKTHYKNNKKGERYVTSTGGSVTGMHGDFILNDDPLNPLEAASESSIKTAQAFITQTLSTRKTNKERSVTIMVMQRLHENDPAGIWLKDGRKLRHICLPGELSEDVSPSELRGKYIDGLLDPIRLGRLALAKLQKDLGSYGYANQIMQKPAPEDGGIWKRGWFIPISDKVFPDIENLKDYGTDWDTAYTDKQVNDAIGYCTTGKYNGNIYIDKLGYFRKEFPEMIRSMRLFPQPHYIEAKASGKSAKQVLKKGGIAAIEVPVIGGDKIARTKMATPAVEAGLVYIRESLLNLLYDDHEQGILKFPNGSHDDMNDALVQAIQRHWKPTRTAYTG